MTVCWSDNFLGGQNVGSFDVYILQMVAGRFSVCFVNWVELSDY